MVFEKIDDNNNYNFKDQLYILNYSHIKPKIITKKVKQENIKFKILEKLSKFDKENSRRGEYCRI